MIKEIGSEFWLDRSNIPEDNNGMPSWLNKFGNVVLTTSGRGALSLLLDQVKPKVKRALLPSYICDSVILPFEKAGYELTYYDVDKHFRPIDLESIKNSNTGIFLHMGYFGFLTNEGLSDTISSLKSESVIVIEDVTHTLFSNQHRPFENDFIVGSIRKWFGTPSGGFIASNKIMNSELFDAENEFVKLREISLHHKFGYINSRDESMKATYLSGFKRAEQILDEDIKPYRIDQTSEMIIKNIDNKKLEDSRKENYEILLKQLKGIEGIEVIFSHLESVITPMFFSIYVKHNRHKLRHNLINKEIYCPVHWPIPKQLNGHLNSTTKDIYNSILSIPCDQRYQVEDMRRIINEICKLVEE